MKHHIKPHAYFHSKFLFLHHQATIEPMFLVLMSKVSHFEKLCINISTTPSANVFMFLEFFFKVSIPFILKKPISNFSFYHHI